MNTQVVRCVRAQDRDGETSGVAHSEDQHAEGRWPDVVDAHKVPQVPVTLSLLWRELP
jgi:hypothetical protein